LREVNVVKRIDASDGVFSFDFLAGFTIFLISLVVVANFVPGLLMGLQRSRSIDFDAVAYRTGVILVEDTGQGPLTSMVEGAGMIGVYGQNVSWDRMVPDDVDRFGFEVAKNSPNILSTEKINRFFSPVFSDADYRSKLLFSTYQYGYNITLRNISPMQSGEPELFKSVGTGPYPTSGFGYIRRYVMIKQNPAVNLNLATTFGRNFDMTSTSQVRQVFTVNLDGDELYNNGIDAPYNLDMQTEPLIIRITNLHTVMNTTNVTYRQYSNSLARGTFTTATFTGVTFTGDDFLEIKQPYTVQVDGKPFVIGTPMLVKDAINITAYLDSSMIAKSKQVYVNLNFKDTTPHILLGGSLFYDYNAQNVTRPDLASGMFEVGIW
jgi:hypothetical protein